MPSDKTILVEDSDSHVVLSTLKTSGYMILYLEYDKIKMVGDLDLKSITPLLLKLAMDKFSK